jgi:spermidine/putrescine transport system permease protein
MSKSPLRYLLVAWSGLIIAFILAPIFTLVWMSFNDGGSQSFPISGYSLKWYARAYQNDDYATGLGNSLAIAAIVAPLATGLALFSAHLLVRRSPRQPALYVLTISLPVLVPVVLSGLALLMFYQELRLAGTIWAIVAAHVCYASPFALAMIRNSYENLNPDFEAAARDLGARRLRVLFRVTLPQLWPSLLSAAAICFLLSWDEFTLAWFVGGFVKTLPTVIYGQLGRSFNPSINAVGAMAFLASSALLAIALTLRQWSLNRQRTGPA